jgi:hypothetical protein
MTTRDCGRGVTRLHLCLLHIIITIIIMVVIILITVDIHRAWWW